MDILIQIKLYFREFFKVFNNFKNIGLFLLSTGFFWLLLIALPNFQTVKLALINSGNPLLNFLETTTNLFAGFLPSSQFTTILTSILFGLNLIIFKKVRMRSCRLDEKTKITTTGGLILSFLGAGCGACGILAVSFLSFFGMGAIVSTLPLGGLEFDIAGIVLLTVSLIFILSQLINNKL